MFFERPDSGEKAVLVHLDLSHGDQADDPREFEELVLSAQGDPVAYLMGKRDVPNARYFIGTGKLGELRQLVQRHCAEVVIFNHVLSPSQERNLEKAIGCRVLDRVGLILDIFAQRARTHEGKLQVELAQLRHIATRLVRGWTHLERQKGGIGLRGPGETQLETDRRLLRGRIRSIEARLEKVRKQRHQGRRARKRAALPIASLVGYTNAGKSTLFNQLTDAAVYAEDQLFATLDPTMRRLPLPQGGPVVVADTVGFISHLPHRLVEAFRATLEEVASADLLLHVIDAAADDVTANVHHVETVLKEIDAAERPQLKIFNKIDLLDNVEPHLDRDSEGRPIAVWMSAQTGAGMDLLMLALVELLATDVVEETVRLTVDRAKLRARLYAKNAVLGEIYRNDGSSELVLRIPTAELNQLLHEENLRWEQIEKVHPQTRIVMTQQISA